MFLFYYLKFKNIEKCLFCSVVPNTYKRIKIYLKKFYNINSFELKDLKLEFDKNKPDGQFRKDVDSSKLLSVLNDFEFTSLEEGIRRVYDNFSQRYN